MLLSARMLNSVASVNQFDLAQPLQLTQGDQATIYLQIIDASKNPSSQGFVPNGRRYMPAVGSSLTVILDNIDDSVKVTRVATQPFPTSDPSIWSIPLLSTDTITGTISVRLILTENGVKTYGSLQAAISIGSQLGFC